MAEGIYVGILIGLLVGLVYSDWSNNRYLELKGDDSAINYTPICVRKKFYYVVPEERFIEMRNTTSVLKRPHR